MTTKGWHQRKHQRSRPKNPGKYVAGSGYIDNSDKHLTWTQAGNINFKLASLINRRLIKTADLKSKVEAINENVDLHHFSVHGSDIDDNGIMLDANEYRTYRLYKLAYIDYKNMSSDDSDIDYSNIATIYRVNKLTDYRFTEKWVKVAEYNMRKESDIIRCAVTMSNIANELAMEYIDHVKSLSSTRKIPDSKILLNSSALNKIKDILPRIKIRTDLMDDSIFKIKKDIEKKYVKSNRHIDDSRSAVVFVEYKDKNAFDTYNTRFDGKYVIFGKMFKDIYGGFASYDWTVSQQSQTSQGVYPKIVKYEILFYIRSKYISESSKH